MASGYDFTQDWFSHQIPVFTEFLGHLKNKPCTLLEIGSFEGRSATWLIENIATHASSTLTTVDLKENPHLRPNLAATGHPDKVLLHLGAPSVEVLRKLPLDTYDFVYVDGCHSTVNALEDAVHSFRLLKVGGVMGFDDYLWDGQAEPQGNIYGRPKEAIDAFLQAYGNEIELLHKGYQVWVRRTERRTMKLKPIQQPERQSRLHRWKKALGTLFRSTHS